MHALRPLTLATFCIFAATLAAAEIICADDICIETVDLEDGVDFYAINRTQALPVTVSIELTTDNLNIVAGLDTPIVVSGGERRPYFSLRAASDGPWNWHYAFGWSRGDYTAQHDDDHQYRLPFVDGEAFRINQGCNGSFSHMGNDRYAVDFGTPVGTTITAARAGTVVDAIESNRRGGPSERFREFDNRIVILHEDRTHAIYSHLQFNGALVEIGDVVEAGQPIGLSGNTGFSSGPHLHFAVAKGQATEYSEITLPITFATANGPVSCPALGTTPRLP